MKKIIIALLIAIITTGCTTYTTEETKLYLVEKYVTHDIGIEVWVEDAPVDGYFFEYDNNTIYSCNEKLSRVIEIYTISNNNKFLKGRYLYLSQDDYKRYIKRMYNL